MGILVDPALTEHPLPSESLVGRSRACAVPLSSPTASAQHALVRWTKDGWEIRDLGSRNGTFVEGVRLAAGERRLLARGARIGFGEPDAAWVLRSDSPPEPAVVGPDGRVVVGEGGMLSLPPPREDEADASEDPEVVVYRDAEGAWVVERGGEVGAAGDSVSVGGVTWRLDLPVPVEGTSEDAAPGLRGAAVRFEVSADEEFCRMTVVVGGRTHALEARVHHYLLLTLARRRMKDAAADPDHPGAHGWVHQSELARKLRIEDAQVNVQIFRARCQLAEVGVAEAAAIVERRSGARQLRIGVADLDVVVL